MLRLTRSLMTAAALAHKCKNQNQLLSNFRKEVLLLLQQPNTFWLEIYNGIHLLHIKWQERQQEENSGAEKNAECKSCRRPCFRLSSFLNLCRHHHLVFWTFPTRILGPFHSNDKRRFPKRILYKVWSFANTRTHTHHLHHQFGKRPDFLWIFFPNILGYKVYIYSYIISTQIISCHHFFLILNSLILTGSVINPFQGALDDHPLHPGLARPLHPHSLSVPTQHLLKIFVRKGCNI